MKKQIHLLGFAQNSVAPHSPGLWRHPKDEGQRHGEISYWIEIAQLLEEGKFDGIFFADVYGVYNVYRNSYKPGIQHAVQSPLHDPLLTISAMASATKNLGFASTISTTYIQPYYLARQLTTLDHLTKGRIGWNIVTSYLESEALNLGLKGKINREERYARAAEYMEVVYKLWEKSWEDGAIVADKESDTYTDPEKVHAINHKGKYFEVPGPHISNPSPQRTPVLFQAGASSKGRDFAAKNAEAIFCVQHDVEGMKAFSKDVRSRAKQVDRNEDDILIFPAMLPIVGSTEEEAKNKYKELQSLLSYDGAVSILSGHLGVDFSVYDPDQYIENIETDAIRGVFDLYVGGKKKWTIREAVMHRGLGNESVKFVGTPEQIADEMELWMDEGDINGFNINQATTPGTFRDFVKYVVPELQKRGRYRTEYEGTTLRENMFGKGNIQLADNHPAKKINISVPTLQ
ncbi:LLM class flavin-dependent oxidoreductase [Oceanobacillus sp. CF4.6]|uniref:LLM class flavin-dependent oxidoreductase n=1 Tax=Oceanobacillus sp. CF4.6 TaxID=3373080 RepID=UPI003EE4FD55